MNPQVFSLLLAMTPGMGGRSVTRTLARNRLLGRSPEEFLRLSSEAMREEYRLTAKAAAAFQAGPALLTQTAALHDRLRGLGVHLVTAADATYPGLVEQMDPDPPGVLFLYGNARLLEARTFCVLSSRRTPPAGLDLIERCAEEGVLNAETLVVGHSTPEYRRAAVVPLRWGSPRILVLDQGLFAALGEELREEAFEAARLWRDAFDPKSDLVVSPFRPETPYAPAGNRLRDRLVASLSARLDAVLVSPGGNVERLMQLALKAGRKVRLVDFGIGTRTWSERGVEIVPL